MKKLLYIALLLILILGFDVTVSNYVIKSQQEIIEEQRMAIKNLEKIDSIKLIINK